jgi:hypothetical protein
MKGTVGWIGEIGEWRNELKLAASLGKTTVVPLTRRQHWALASSSFGLMSHHGVLACKSDL